MLLLNKMKKNIFAISFVTAAPKLNFVNSLYVLFLIFWLFD